MNQIFVLILKLNIIGIQRHKHGVCTDTFVAINKWVICNQSVSKADGFVNNARIKLHIVEGLERLADCGIQQSFITNAIRSSRLSDQL